MDELLNRWTLWETRSNGDPLQLSLAILSPSWDPLMERTVPCGPWHGAEERRLELLDDARRWMATYGWEATLL